MKNRRVDSAGRQWLRKIRYDAKYRITAGDVRGKLANSSVWPSRLQLTVKSTISIAVQKAYGSACWNIALRNEGHDQNLRITDKS